MRQMRHGQDTDQPSQLLPLALAPLPRQHCHKSFSCRVCRRMTHARTALGLAAIRTGATLGRRQQQQQQVPACLPTCLPFRSAGSTSRVVCTFWRSQIVLLPWIQQIGKCSQVAAASHVPQQIPSPPIAHSPRRPVAPSPHRFGAVRSHLIIKISSKTFGAALSIIYIKIQIK